MKEGEEEPTSRVGESGEQTKKEQVRISAHGGVERQLLWGGYEENRNGEKFQWQRSGSQSVIE